MHLNDALGQIYSDSNNLAPYSVFHGLLLQFQVDDSASPILCQAADSGLVWKSLRIRAVGASARAWLFGASVLRS